MINSEESVEMVMMDYISPHHDLGFKDSNLFFFF